MYAVFPSLTGRYDVPGVGKIRTHKQEKLAAIKLQRRWRDARARRRGGLRGMNDANKKLVVFGRLQAKMFSKLRIRGSTADWCARCVGGVSAALSFGVCCLNGGEERDEGALHML